MIETDIIIPSYKNEELTVACFESIKENTQKETYRIIWIDNGSENISRLKESLKETHHIMIHSSENFGFVTAVNIGLVISDAPFVCILNNDTVVSYRWLEKLVAALNKSPKLGIVGPVTAPPKIKGRNDSQHCIGYIEDLAGRRMFSDFMNLEDFNKEIEIKFNGVLAEVSFVAFLCAVIKREVINKIGLLDINYAMGMWDDNDYNFAVRKAGYETKLLYDTCIYHRGRSTFNLIQEKEGFDVDSLLKSNRKYLDQKWGLKNA